jgi:hypothetical protein
MASTYSPLKIELITTGEQANTWGATTNVNLGTAIEEAIVGSVDVPFSSADVTLTLTNVNTTQAARNLRLNLTGTSGGTRNLILGDGCQINKPYLVNNGLADAVTVKNTTGTGIAVPAGKTMWVYNNGTNVVDAVTHLSSLTLGSALPITSGGTGTTSTTFVNLASNVTGDLPFANLTQIAGLSVLGVTGNTTADVAGITAASDHQVFRRSGTSVGFGSIALDQANAVTGILAAGNGGTSNAFFSVSGPSSSIKTYTFPNENMSVGYRNIPAIADKTTSYSLAVGDVGKVVGVGTGGSITIPNSTFAAGDAVLIFNNTSGSITITCSITTAYIAGVDTDRDSVTLASRGVCNILFISGTVCVLTGNVS